LRSSQEEIFPVGDIECKLRRRLTEDPMKLRASPAHSDRFMERLLIKVLKKAGYDEVGKDSGLDGVRVE
jgi:hypothetical protein